MDLKKIKLVFEVVLKNVAVIIDYMEKTTSLVSFDYTQTTFVVQKEIDVEDTVEEKPNQKEDKVVVREVENHPT